jgi:hypothetical protein
MRLSLAALVFAILPIGLWQTCPPSWSEDSAPNPAIYDPNPNHLWNRLHAAIFIRPDIPSTTRLPDALDPPLWYQTSYLLAQPSHQRIMKILDEFLNTHGERLIQNPVKRAILDRDLWWVFDWSVEQQPDYNQPAYEKEKQELQSRLAEVMRRVALTPEEIRALPSNYALAVGSGQFGKEYDPAHPERPFLPSDLFDPNGPWVQLYGNRPSMEPVALSHAQTFSRSVFLVFMRQPAGRKATFDYLQTLWDFPQPWIPSPDDDRHEQTSVNPNLPQFPVGTEVALVRQMMLFDNQGNVVATPITESVQIRFYRKISEIDRIHATTQAEAMRGSGQDFYQFRLSRPQLFAAHAGALRAIERDEKEFVMFSSMGFDEREPGPVMQSCFMCHRQAGINSLNTRKHLLKPNWLQHDSPAGPGDRTNSNWWQYDSDTNWKQGRYEWGLLNGFWKAGEMSPR